MRQPQGGSALRQDW